jgi:hypothetical protein
MGSPVTGTRAVPVVRPAPESRQHAEFIAGDPGRMTADAKAIDWPECATLPRRQ